jgi:short-subunit dehydrogenase
MDKQLKGSWALVTGASGGMGADFARQLAVLGFNLVITARRQDALEALKAEIQAANGGVSVQVAAGDLADGAFRASLASQTAALDLSVLINNAGFGAYGPFDSLDWAKEEQMLDLDIKALVHLTKLYAPRLKTRGRGFILQTASIGAFQPCPLYASYGAAKSFVLNYGLAVRRELRGSGVSVMVLSPGVTETGFFDAAGNNRLSGFQKSSMMPSAAVVRSALKSLLKGRATHVPGLLNRVNAFCTRFVGRGFAAGLALKLME